MQSVIEPLTKKVDIFTTHIATILYGLGAGDPAARVELDGLWKDLANFKQDCQSTLASLSASYENSTATAQSSNNPSPMIKMIVYYIKEVAAAITLISSLIKLITTLVSISSLLEYLDAKLVNAQQNLNTKTVWLTRALTRTKQKISKTVEWEKRAISAKLEIVYYKSQQKQYTESIAQLQANLPIKPTPVAGLGGNGTYVNGSFVYFNQAYNVPMSSTSMLSNSVSKSVNNLATGSAQPPILYNVDVTKSQLQELQNKLDDVTNELVSAQNELSINIPADKLYWNNLWKAQEAQDKKDLLNNIPAIGLN